MLIYYQYKINDINMKVYKVFEQENIFQLIDQQIHLPFLTYILSYILHLVPGVYVTMKSKVNMFMIMNHKDIVDLNNVDTEVRFLICIICNNQVPVLKSIYFIR